jgi:predicted Rossmann fold nucleotide-binding protein DprA/Smf involved in DNA uptake
MERLQRTATANSIVTILKSYGPNPIPVDFLAQAVGRRTPEILESLLSLEKDGVIKRQDDTVALLIP